VEILGAYGSLELGSVKRIILAEIDFEEAMVPLAAIRNEILFLSLIIAIVIFGIALFVAHGITRPLVRLKNAANFIALGNYNQQLEIGENDEIGELTRAFNSIATEIKSTTQDLRENEERLRHFYRATLDGIILHDNDRMLLFNSAMVDLTGYSENELMAFRVTDFLQLKKGQECEKDTERRTFESILFRPKISEAQHIFDRIIGDIRRISHDLSPSILQEFGLRAAMENLCNGMAKTSGIRVDFSFNLGADDPDEMTATYLYRIAQEALNNAQRHSGASEVKVSLNKDQFGFLLDIEDNGCGFHVKEIAKKGGNGLKALLTGSGDIYITAEAGSAEELLQKIGSCPADVALVDISLPGISGIKLTEQLSLSHPELKVDPLHVPE
jgi:nitrogen fixation/metabolism regulation signal transduction histidine kinase